MTPKIRKDEGDPYTSLLSTDVASFRYSADWTLCISVGPDLLDLATSEAEDAAVKQSLCTEHTGRTLSTFGSCRYGTTGGAITYKLYVGACCGPKRVAELLRSRGAFAHGTNTNNLYNSATLVRFLLLLWYITYLRYLAWRRAFDSSQVPSFRHLIEAQKLLPCDDCRRSIGSRFVVRFSSGFVSDRKKGTPDGLHGVDASDLVDSPEGRVLPAVIAGSLTTIRAAPFMYALRTFGKLAMIHTGSKSGNHFLAFDVDASSQIKQFMNQHGVSLMRPGVRGASKEATVKRFIPRALHRLGTILPQDYPSLAMPPFAMTSARNALLRDWSCRFEFFPSMENACQMLVAEPGVGKTHFLVMLTLALKLWHQDSIVTVYISLKSGICPSHALYTALYLAGHTDVVNAPGKNIRSLVSWATFEKELGVFIVVDELQEGAAWRDVLDVSRLRDELQFLSETHPNLWVIFSGSSQFTVALTLGNSHRVRFPRRFTHHQMLAWCLKRNQVTLRFDRPVSSRSEFFRIVEEMLSPHVVEHDTAVWSLEYVAQSALSATPAPVDIDQDFIAADEEEFESHMMRLFVVTGGNLRKLFGDAGLLIRGGGRETLTPITDDRVFEEVYNQCRVYDGWRADASDNPEMRTLITLMDALFEANCALFDQTRVEQVGIDFFDLVSVSPTDLQPTVELEHVLSLADQGLLSLNLGSTGDRWISVRFSRPALFVAILYLRKLKDKCAVEDLWAARIVLSSAGVMMEHVINKALLEHGGLAEEHLDNAIGVRAYENAYLSVIPALTSDGLFSESAWWHTTIKQPIVLVLVDNTVQRSEEIERMNRGRRVHFGKSTRLRRYEDMLGTLLRTFPHNKPGGGADAIVLNAGHVDLLQYKAGASDFDREQIRAIIANLSNAQNAFQENFRLLGISLPFKMHLLTTRPLNNAQKTELVRNGVQVWDRTHLASVWPAAIKELRKKFAKAEGVHQ
ncbi:hypothetical protein BC832DRAFT_540873 [Gaertneriomyces semiglobifer]|nr:hypothetical protein BC832DRAFT_540873 [Gaertneriomyces semiglobifer]